MPVAARVTSARAHQKYMPKHQTNLRRSPRQTRSRSRELGGIYDEPATVASVSEDESQDNALSHTPTKRNRVGKLGSRTGKNAELSPVFEKARANTTGSFNSNLTRQNSRRSERSVPESPVDHFNITGTTLLATDSEHESREMDPSIMIEALPDLDTSAKNVLRVLAPRAFSLPGILKNFEVASFRARVKRIQETFETQRKYFGGQHFISVEGAVNMLPSLKHVPWYPDEFIQRANLAQFVLDLIPLRGKLSPFSERHLSDLDDFFPTFFVSSFLLPEDNPIKQPGQSALQEETFQLGLEIRTQHAIAALRSKQNSIEFAPDVVLDDIFTTSRNSEDEVEALRGWEINGLYANSEKFTGQFRDKINERIESIRMYFDMDSTSPFVHFTPLESSYPWSQFVIQTAKWIRKRADEIDAQLENQTSLDEAVEMLQIEVDRRSSLDQRGIDSIRESTTSDPSANNVTLSKQADVQKPKETESASTKQSMLSIGKGIFKSKAFVSHLMNLQARMGSSVASSAQDTSNIGADKPSDSPQIESVAVARDSTPQTTDDGARPRPSGPSGSHKSSARRTFRQSATPIEPTRRTPQDASARPSPSEIVKIAERQRLSAASQRQRPTFKTPPAAFIDRQADAHRLSPIGSSQLSSGRSRVNGRSNKRQASEDEQSEGQSEEEHQTSDEEGFEAFSRNIPIERKSSSLAALPGRKRRRIETAPTGPQSRPSGTTLRPSQSLESRRDSRTESTSVEFVRKAGNIPPVITASEINRRVRKPGGGRIPWSVDECNQLKKLIIRYGPKWAKIKQVDDGLEVPKLSIRDQVNLKDKARQMAVDFYKTGQPLPENFEKIALKTEDKRKLREIGITIFEDMTEGLD
ncbi:hypothetical protein AJ78_02384 [Emergomyces pasteurianus Ep9510]|uniref:Myb-like domain-containing protein n=1 Tax=Emergomyces pasteurianus Ep9510 TaxID=1447872 RepID=A0A1J9QB91_9EURO|nr:hypothetical protein AJ78_02384 [Emergomyces pasteurianus Ep9510]